MHKLPLIVGLMFAVPFFVQAVTSAETGTAQEKQRQEISERELLLKKQAEDERLRLMAEEKRIKALRLEEENRLLQEKKRIEAARESLQKEIIPTPLKREIEQRIPERERLMRDTEVTPTERQEREEALNRPERVNAIDLLRGGRATEDTLRERAEQQEVRREAREGSFVQRTTERVRSFFQRLWSR